MRSAAALADEAWPQRVSKYDHLTWFDGNVHVLTRFDHFDGSPEYMRHVLYNYAYRLGKIIRTTIRDEKLYVQVVGKRKPYKS